MLVPHQISRLKSYPKMDIRGIKLALSKGAEVNKL
jgi:hypothetical protein